MTSTVMSEAPEKRPTRVREVHSVLNGQPAVDGSGVKLTRVIGSPQLTMLDPFLLLDVFESDQPQDYLGGFPDHPHRGFETVTYLLHGRMRHKDSAGHEGVIEPGGVQWMTAGSGIVHSEMPEQEDGMLMGFQLWINLPADAKMIEPAYQEFPASDIPVDVWGSGAEVRVIAGRTQAGTEGPAHNHYVDPTFMDIRLREGGRFDLPLPPGHNAFIYVIDGEILVGKSKRNLVAGTLGVLAEGDEVYVSATGSSRFLLVAGHPLEEPVARGGPFVMNTREEVLQAFEDFENNRF